MIGVEPDFFAHQSLRFQWDLSAWGQEVGRGLAYRCTGHDKAQHLNTRICKSCASCNSSRSYAGIDPIVLDNSQENFDRGLGEKFEANTGDERLVNEDCYRTVFRVLECQRSRKKAE